MPAPRALTGVVEGGPETHRHRQVLVCFQPCPRRLPPALASTPHMVGGPAVVGAASTGGRSAAVPSVVGGGLVNRVCADSCGCPRKGATVHQLALFCGGGGESCSAGRYRDVILGGRRADRRADYTGAAAEGAQRWRRYAYHT